MWISKSVKWYHETISFHNVILAACLDDVGIAEKETKLAVRSFTKDEGFAQDQCRDLDNPRHGYLTTSNASKLKQIGSQEGVSLDWHM